MCVVVVVVVVVEVVVVAVVVVLVVVVVVVVGVRVRVCRRGLRVLEHGFTREHGWEGAGAPRKLLRLDNLPKAVAARMNSAEMLRCDCWDSVGAAGDQVVSYQVTN